MGGRVITRCAGGHGLSIISCIPHAEDDNVPQGPIRARSVIITLVTRTQYAFSGSFCLNRREEKYKNPNLSVDFERKCYLSIIFVVARAMRASFRAPRAGSYRMRARSERIEMVVLTRKTYGFIGTKARRSFYTLNAS